MIVKSLPGVNALTTGGTYLFGHTFGKGDLQLFCYDSGNNPKDPFAVTYCLAFKAKGQECYATVGPLTRTPVHGAVGEFYATGIAGELGQPGQWKIIWTVQEAYNTPLMTAEFSFVVFSPSDYSVGFDQNYVSVPQNRTCWSRF